MDILIIKIGALGDVVRTSFLAQAIKDKYKKESPKMYWISDKKAKPLFINSQYIDYFIESENKDRIKNISFDLIINLEEDEETCAFASSLKYKEFIGFGYSNRKVFPTPTTREWFAMSVLGKKPLNDILKKKNKKTHRQLMAEIARVSWERYAPFLRLSLKQREIAKNFARRYNLSSEDFILGINVGGADRWPKSLPIKKTVSLIERLYKEFQAKILLFGGPNEIERNKEILKKVKVPVIDTGCGNDLIEFPALISLCKIIISTDSLGLHLALALKRKTVCLVGPTSPSEIDMYNTGEKIIAKSSCVCCYKKTCRSMEKINIEEIILAVKKIKKEKIFLVITAFKEKKIGKAIEAALNQKTKYEYDIVVSAPDKETLDIARVYEKKYNRIKIFKDPGKGKSYALNLLFKKLDSDILILTDGDIWISSNSVEEIAKKFSDPEIGCVGGRPVPVEKKTNKYGYWANFLFDAAHRIRKKASENYEFLECSAYLFAFRKKIIKQIPLDVAEDAIIPYYFWENGYRIGYAENAEVYLTNAHNWKDWIKQKIRTSKAHEKLSKYVNTSITPRVKTFWNEGRGVLWAFRYLNNIKELIWTFELVFARLYMWIKVYIDTKFFGKEYGDSWERVESAR